MYFRDSDAYLTSLALKKLRRDNCTGVIDLLETRLDSEIIQCGDLKDPYRSPYNIAWLVFQQNPKEAHNHLLSSVAEYRRSHPSYSMSSEVREKVSKILAKTSDGTRKINQH